MRGPYLVKYSSSNDNQTWFMLNIKRKIKGHGYVMSQEPSIQEYARFYGLTRDHLEHDPLQDLRSPDDFLFQLNDGTDLFHIDESNGSAPKERMFLDRDTMTLLSSVSQSSKTPLPFDEEAEFDTHRVRQLKQEPPLLSTDHENDLLMFAPRVVPELEHEFLPLETLDEEADEGLSWPSRYKNLPDEVWKTHSSEKLEISSDALLFLQQTLKYHLEGGDQPEFEVDEMPYKRKTVSEHLSPPLLPLSPESIPFIRSTDAVHLDLLSDCTSSTSEELRKNEGTIFAEDQIAPTKRPADMLSTETPDRNLLGAESLGDVYSPLKMLGDPVSSPPQDKVCIQDRKVEVPLLPPMSVQRPPCDNKNVSLTDALTELVPSLPPPIAEAKDAILDHVDTLIEEVIAPVGIEPKRNIEKEQQREDDTTLRVSVPIMDFSLPVAPDDAASRVSKAKATNEACGSILTEMKSLHFETQVWPTSGEAERELQWTPFPAGIGKVGTQESIKDDGFAEEYISPPACIDVETLTWKPEGLRLLDETANPEEEKLGEGVFPQGKEMESLIRKRKFEMDVEGDDMGIPDSYPASRLWSENRVLKPSALIEQEKQKSRMPQILLGGSFSPVGSLESFIDVRKGRFERLEVPVAHETATKPSAVPPAAPVHIDSPKNSAASDSNIPTQRRFSPLLPPITVPSSPCPFVVSTSFLGNRKLSRCIQRLFPSAEFIERDFTLHSASDQATQSIEHKSAQVRLNTMADEADMILSPSTGLLWTTLQRIKQRSLPGQAVHSAIRDRILRAAPRYERLVVLVSEDRQLDVVDMNSGTTELDSSDCEALAETMAFCARLEEETQAVFVTGGQEELARSIVATMVKYTVTEPVIRLIQDETLWEIFLRRAGMNAFAAQAILAELKESNRTEQAGDESLIRKDDLGLNSFIKMTVEQRLARFGTLFGGGRLLNRISRLLDARW